MTEVVEGASLPDGIDVDETSAYFGITKSSDIVHQLMSMDLNQSLGQFFSMVADIVLKPGDFDFEEASKILNCEGGEIYYLVSGHFGLMSFTDPLLHYLGLQNSLGEDSPNAKPAITNQEFQSLKKISDPMNMLKILAIAHNTGGSTEVVKYFIAMEEILQNAATNVAQLIEIAEQFDASLDVIGHVIPITTLANSKVDSSNQSSMVDINPNLINKSPDKEITTTPVSTVETQTLKKLDQVIESVPLPGQKATKSNTAPGSTKPIAELEIPERKAAKVTNTAFEGAFGISTESSLATKEHEALEEVIDSEKSAPKQESEQTNEPTESISEVATEEPFVSAAEMFVKADSDDDGALSVEELSEASGLSIDESRSIHQSADKDDDGSMSLSEYIASPAVEKVAANLPRPVAPVRKPINLGNQKPVADENTSAKKSLDNPQHNTMQRSTPMPKPNLTPQPIVRPSPISQAPSAQFPQQIQPTIRSGVTCRGCGIGIDPFWRFCPVCGGQNLG